MDHLYVADLATSKSPRWTNHTPKSQTTIAIRMQEYVSACLPAQFFNPLPPPRPLLPPQALFPPLISHHRQSLHISPLMRSPTPTRLPHQTHKRLFFTPTLFYRHIREVGSAVAFVVVLEGNADAVSAEIPVKGITGRFEMREEGNAGTERGQFAGRYGGESSIVECAGGWVGLAFV